MSKLQDLNVYLTERLMLAAEDIYKAIENTVLEYQGEIIRERRQNDQLKRKLRAAGISWPEQEPISPLDFDEEEWLPTIQGQESLSCPKPEKQDHDSRNGETEIEGLGLKVTAVSGRNNDCRLDLTGVSSHKLQDHAEQYLEGDSMSSSPSKQIKTEICPPIACPSTFPSTDTFSSNPDCTGPQAETSVSTMESVKLLSQLEGLQSPEQFFQNDKAASGCTRRSKPCRRFSQRAANVQLQRGGGAYLCGLCGKCFTSSGRLKGHQMIHTGEKPYQCHVCLKRFNQTAHLNVHLRVHTGEKPFSCPVCGKCFTQSNKVKRHLVTHSREVVP